MKHLILVTILALSIQVLAEPKVVFCAGNHLGNQVYAEYIAVPLKSLENGNWKILASALGGGVGRVAGACGAVKKMDNDSVIASAAELWAKADFGANDWLPNCEYSKDVQGLDRVEKQISLGETLIFRYRFESVILFRNISLIEDDRRDLKKFCEDQEINFNK